MDSEQMEQRSGLRYGLAAFVAWGLLPFYWRELAEIPSMQVLAHRVVWSCLLLLALIGAKGRMRELRAVLSAPRTALTLLVTAILIGANWLLYIWGLSAGYYLEASLAYFMAPLFMVAAGALMGERLRGMQGAAIVLMLIGVLLQIAQGSRVPFFAVGLALTWTFYALLRRKLALDSLVGLAAETLLMFPPAAMYLAWCELGGSGALLHSSMLQTVYLIGAGVVTALPLLWFVRAARSLKVMTMGLLQYVTPSLQFLGALVISTEALSGSKLWAFGLIWCALALYSWESWRRVPVRAE